ncbi:MAG TPA: site-2 protease family protein [Candidatus Hydrogenedentes bacterium]|jgi:Zn-dependent protease|nr:site-2 protease family protein [Candidatus Hydrogenedentota bacterium]
MSPHIAEIFAAYVCLLFCLSVHEAAHAWVSDWAGDPTARLQGRVTLNPLPHIDPFGTVLFPLIMLFANLPVFGWARPVPFNQQNLRSKRWGPVAVALAGPLSHLAQLVVLIAGARLAFLVFHPDLENQGGGPWITLLWMLVQLNLILMLFNLIPVPPLDGHHVLYAFLPPRGQHIMERIGPYGILIAVLVMRYGMGQPLVFLGRLAATLLFKGVAA